MKIPPYWIKEEYQGCDGNKWKLHGVSYKSMHEARERLEQRRKLREDFASHPSATEEMVYEHRAMLRALDELESEDYETLMLEPVLEQIDADTLITRNHYGVQVLNSTSLCFVDVDDFPLSLGDTIRGLFGNRITPEEKLMRRLRELCEADSSLGARLYRTCNGWRIMLTGTGILPDSPRMHQLFAALHADPLYQSLCSRQKCWRARLTPKPYRVGAAGYPRPVDSESIHSPESQAWLQRYEQACTGKAVCRLVESMGKHFESSLVELHDKLTSAGIPDMPLA